MQYSVVQSDRNIFCDDVVLDSFDLAFKDEDSILDQIYVIIYTMVFYLNVFSFHYNILLKKAY